MTFLVGKPDGAEQRAAMGRPKTIETSELLSVAREVFRQHGPSATTRAVAKAAGITQAVLYQRFKTKDALFLAALTHFAPSLASISAIDATKLDPKSYLALFAARTKDHYRSVMPSILSHAAHPKYGKEMMGQIHRHNRAGEISAMLCLRLVAWQQAGLIRPMDPRVFAHTFLHALHTMAMVELLSGDDEFYVTNAKEMEAVVDLFWHGLQANKSAKPKTPRAKKRK